MILHMTTTNDKMGSPSFTLCVPTLYFQFLIPKKDIYMTLSCKYFPFSRRIKIGSLNNN